MNLSQVVSIDEEKCVNCHQCIVACSTKFANKADGDVVRVNDDLCIGCGQCINACSHDARIPIDDFMAWRASQEANEPCIAVVAPAIAAQFENNYLEFNGWLKSQGIAQVFDVSFGAELTVKSYVNHIKENKPKTVIAQPCPAIVTYIEVYKPELIPYLAPADSPMMHTVKMVKQYYPEFANHKVLMVSPCLAKKREFDEVGMVDFNVTFNSFEQHFIDSNIDLSQFEKTDFYNESAERAVLFSSPGGLLKTAEREVPEIGDMTRKIEGSHIIYSYLDDLHKQIKTDKAPVLVDCLNCECGCNGGSGTNNRETPIDELEFAINRRKNEMLEKYKTQKHEAKPLNALRNTIDDFWTPGLYNRTYVDRSELYKEQIKKPSLDELDVIYKQMHKYKEEDFLNCASCGYHTCEMMAEAIHNGLNKVENCHFYLSYEHNMKSEEVLKKDVELEKQKKVLIDQSEQVLSFIHKIRQLAKLN